MGRKKSARKENVHEGSSWIKLMSTNAGVVILADGTFLVKTVDVLCCIFRCSSPLTGSEPTGAVTQWTIIIIKFKTQRPYLRWI